MTTPWNTNYENKTVPFSDTSVRFALATNAAQTYTVPGNDTQKYQAVFKYTSTSNIFVGLNFTPTVPTAGTNETTSTEEYRPDCKYVKGGDVLSLITPDASAYVGVSLLAISG
jgi:hypothetical protein